MGNNAHSDEGPAVHAEGIGSEPEDPQSAILRRAVQVAKVTNEVDHAQRKVKHRDRADAPPSSEHADALAAQSEKAPQGGTATDPRIAALEMHIDANNWRGVSEILGGQADLEKLPPGLMLIAALASSESSLEGSPAAIAAAGKAVAHLLQVPETSPLARVISRRILRKNPVRLRDREAPNGKVTTLILFGTILLGAAIGWLATGGAGNLWAIVRASLHH